MTALEATKNEEIFEAESQRAATEQKLIAEVDAYKVHC